MSPDGPRRAAGDPVRIGVLGAAGQVGRCVVDEVRSGPDLELAFAVTRKELDLADLAAIEPWLAGPGAVGADVVVNAAGFTKVDACEREPERARLLNGRMPGEWAQRLRRRDVRFLHLSTDYVFPGDATRPYREDDPTGPRCVYGASKREGEERVLEADPRALIVRTSWVFGPGRNFVLAILEQAAARREGTESTPLRVVDDQRGSPTAAVDLARGLVALCRRLAAGGAAVVPNAVEAADAGPADGPGLHGLLHLCNAGETSWFGFARAILDQAGYGDVVLEPVATGVFPTAAPRPAYSVLDCSRARALGLGLRPWTEALAGYLAQFRRWKAPH